MVVRHGFSPVWGRRSARSAAADHGRARRRPVRDGASSEDVKVLSQTLNAVDLDRLRMYEKSLLQGPGMLRLARCVVLEPRSRSSGL
jgi:hypothetical protein